MARHMPVMALLTPDPVSLLAGWSDEFKTSFSREYQTYLQRFPGIAKVPLVGRHTPTASRWNRRWHCGRISSC